MSERANNDGIAVAGITAEELRRLEAWAQIHGDAATAALAAKVARLEADRDALAAALRGVLVARDGNGALMLREDTSVGTAKSALARLDAGEGAERGERGGEG